MGNGHGKTKEGEVAVEQEKPDLGKVFDNYIFRKRQAREYEKEMQVEIGKDEYNIKLLKQREIELGYWVDKLRGEIAEYYSSVDLESIMGWLGFNPDEYIEEMRNEYGRIKGKSVKPEKVNMVIERMQKTTAFYRCYKATLEIINSRKRDATEAGNMRVNQLLAMGREQFPNGEFETLAIVMERLTDPVSGIPVDRVDLQTWRPPEPKYSGKTVPVLYRGDGKATKLGMVIASVMRGKNLTVTPEVIRYVRDYLVSVAQAGVVDWFQVKRRHTNGRDRERVKWVTSWTPNEDEAGRFAAGERVVEIHNIPVEWVVNISEIARQSVHTALDWNDRGVDHSAIQNWKMYEGMDDPTGGRDEWYLLGGVALSEV